MAGKVMTRRRFLIAAGAALGIPVLLYSGLTTIGEATTITQGGIASLGPAGTFLNTGA